MARSGSKIRGAYEGVAAPKCDFPRFTRVIRRLRSAEFLLRGRAVAGGQKTLEKRVRNQRRAKCGRSVFGSGF